jgi:hypothetical protein
MTKHNVFSNLKDTVVWAIDDAWFSGSQSLDVKLGLALSLPSTLADLSHKVASKSVVHSNFSYLETLIAFCLQHDLRLGLGSFEYFQQEFGRIDSYHTAVLLDVHYQPESQTSWPPESYGVYVLKQMLNGNRPKSEYIFVTAYPDNVKAVLELRKDDPLWWPLQNRITIDKRDPKLKDRLTPFFENFAGRQKSESRLRELARSLIDERRQGHDYTHPQSIETLQAQHQNLALLSSFAEEDRAQAGAGVESYTALYHTSKKSGQRIKRNVYTISTQLFYDHCRYLGLTVDIKEQRRFYLPVMPGLVFLLYYCNFVLSLNAPTPTPTLSFLPKSNQDWASLSIELEDNLALRASILGSEELGKATTWFKRTLRGEGRFVFELAGYDEEETPWMESEPYKAKIFPLLVAPVFSDKEIALNWRCGDHASSE